METVKSKQDAECTIAGLYDLSAIIGKGHFATVRLARHVFTGEKVAVKVIDKTKLDPISREHLFQEVRCMKLVQHPHIVRLYEVIDTQTKLYLILELGDGDMYDYIMNNHDRGLDIDTAKMYFRQILEAISYCHALHVVHRDLKPENVIFFEKLGIVKLTDFGFSNRFEPDTKLETSCGSLAYSAPEILLGDSYDAPAVDVWSLGVLLFMLVTGEPPFQEANDSETLTMIMDCKYHIPAHIPTDCAGLISSMLRREPKERISLLQIMDHPWLHAGRKCCLDVSCIALVGRENLSSEDHETIIQRMADGGIASRTEINRALESDEYSHVTATYYLLAERRLKRQQAEQTHIPLLRPHTGRSQRLMHNATPTAEVPSDINAVQIVVDSPTSPGSLTGSVSLSVKDEVFSGSPFSVASAQGAYSPVPHDRTMLTVSTEPNQRKFSLICEEEEENSDADDLQDTVISVKEIKSATWCTKSLSNPHQPMGLTNGNVGADFEQTLSNMSLQRRGGTHSPLPNNSAPHQWGLRSVTSSPQLQPLKQIHEEGEASPEEDALSIHSQTSLVRLRHSSMSMASPELARKILSKKLKPGISGSSSDTSENDEEKHKDPAPKTNIPHKRKDSDEGFSDSDGPSVTRASTTASHRTRQQSDTQTRYSTAEDSPSAKRRFDGSNLSTHSVGTATSFNTTLHDASTNTPSPSFATAATESFRTASQPLPESLKKNANNNNKEDTSLKMIASKLVEGSLSRLSNFSLASQSSSLSSKSSCKLSLTPHSSSHSSQRRSREGRREDAAVLPPLQCRPPKDGKFSKLRLMDTLRKDLSELSDREDRSSICTDSDVSLPNSLRIKVATSSLPIDWNRKSVIAEEQVSFHSVDRRGTKGATDCCTVM